MTHEEVKRQLRDLQTKLRDLEVEIRLSEKRLLTEVNQVFKSTNLPTVKTINNETVSQLQKLQKDLMDGMDDDEMKNRPNPKTLSKTLSNLEKQRDFLNKELAVKKAMFERQKRDFNEQLSLLVRGLGIKTSITCDERDRLKKMKEFMQQQLSKLQNEAQTKQ
jgi:hypothetical protein